MSIWILYSPRVADLEEKREVKRQDASEWANRYYYSHLECSAKQGDNIELAFQTLIRKIRESKQTTNKFHQWISTEGSHEPQCCRYNTLNASPNYRYCNNMIWGIADKHGYVCAGCSAHLLLKSIVCMYPAHKECMMYVTADCGGLDSRPMVRKLTKVEQLVSFVSERELQICLQV